MILSPDPAARVAELRQCLHGLADTLRQKGAQVEPLESENDGLHAIGLLITTRSDFPGAAALAFKMRRHAERTGGFTAGTLLTTEQTGVPEGEYRVALLYQVGSPDILDDAA